MKIVCKQYNCLNDKFIDRIKFENECYSFALPFKENRPMLADNYQLCLNRLQKLKERLSKTPHLLKEHIKVFHEYLNLGITEKVKNEGIADEVVYLPHKDVIKEDRSTAKLRIVFHASVKYKGTSSRNEVLYKEPCLNADLYSLLLKFRIYPIAVTSDKEKVYFQISINEEHRDFLRFLWYSDLSEEIVSKYRFTRVISGATSSQFLLNGIVQAHGSKYEKTDP